MLALFFRKISKVEQDEIMKSFFDVISFFTSIPLDSTANNKILRSNNTSFQLHTQLNIQGILDFQLNSAFKTVTTDKSPALIWDHLFLGFLL